MADPVLRVMKKQETGRRLWIGPLDGLLKGFEMTRGSSAEQLEIASMQIVEFILNERRIGLQCLTNRMRELKNVDNPELEESRWKKNGDAWKCVRGAFQTWRSQIKAHKKNCGNMDKFAWPPASKQTEEILDELVQFANLILQYTAVDEWCTVLGGHSTSTDDKFTKGIIEAFWMGRINHPAWLAQKAAWDARETFGQILKQASGTSFEYPDGAQTMDTSNEYAAEAEDNENDGYFGSFNKHVIQKDIAHMRMQQTRYMDKIIQSVIASGSVRGVDGNQKIPKKVKQALNTLVEARTSELV